MDERTKRELMDGRIPKKCPFCDVDWYEFKVQFFEGQYYDESKKTLHERVIDDGVTVFCTRCEEEIREEDVNERK